MRVVSSSRISAAATRSIASSRVASSSRSIASAISSCAGPSRPLPHALGGRDDFGRDVVERRGRQVEAEKPRLLGGAQRDLDDGDVARRRASTSARAGAAAARISGGVGVGDARRTPRSRAR